MGDSPAKAHVTKRIEQLNEEYQSLEKRIQELEGLTTQHALSDVEFDLMRQLLTVFKDGIDEMTIEQNEQPSAPSCVRLSGTSQCPCGSVRCAGR